MALKSAMATAGLAEQLLGPPLKDDVLLGGLSVPPWFGRAIARPSIEGSTTRWTAYGR